MRLPRQLILFSVLAAAVGAGQDAASLANAGAEFAIEGRLPEAALALEQALALRKQAEPRDATALAHALNDLGVVYKLQDRQEDAARLYQRAIEILRQEPRGAHDPLLATALHNLGKLRTDQKRYKEAESLLREAVQRWEERLGPDHPDLAAGLSSLAAVVQARRHLNEAARLFDRASRIDLRNFPPDHVRIALDLNNTAALEAARKHYIEAERLLWQSVSLLEKKRMEKRDLPGDPVLGMTLGNLGEVLYARKKLEDAQQTYQRAMELLTRAWGPNDRRLLEWMERYAAVLRAGEDFVGAERVAMQAMKIRVSNMLR